MTAPRFYLVTNDAARCALQLWCHAGNLPASIAVIDDPDLMLRIPDGAQVRCCWFGTPAELEPWENFWWSRRIKGGFDWISAEDWDRIMGWAERERRDPCLRLLYGQEPANDNADEAGTAIEIAPVEPAKATEPAAPKRKAKWS